MDGKRNPSEVVIYLHIAYREQTLDSWQMHSRLVAIEWQSWQRMFDIFDMDLSQRSGCLNGDSCGIVEVGNTSAEPILANRPKSILSSIMQKPDRTIYQQSSLVMAAQVCRVLPAGLVVLLPDGREGIVRERELTWDVESRCGWNDRYKPGDVIGVTLLGKGRQCHPELSVRLAGADAWSNVEERFQVGQLAEGVVTGIMPYGIFVELMPGIAGLVHISRLPPAFRERLGEIFWLGDRVKVLIDAINSEMQRISLSMLGLQSHRWNRQTAEARQIARVPSAVPVDETPHLSVDMLSRVPPKSVLVVEDEPDQRDAVAGWLRHARQRVQAVGSVAEALQQIANAVPDLVLMDIGLIGTNGIEGVRLIKNLHPFIRCALMTDWSRAEKHADELEQLKSESVPLLIKPLLPEDMLSILLDRRVNDNTRADLLSPARTAFAQATPLLKGGNQSELIQLLGRLRSSTQADIAVVFEFDSDARRVNILEQHGLVTLHLGALPDLIHSPVRNVAEDGQTVLARDEREATNRRFIHLTQLLKFEVCLGVPVPALLHHRYALFLFYAQPAAISESIRLRAEAAAASIGAWLERQQFVRQTADIHRVALLGQLGRALVHEVSGRLTPLGLALDQLSKSCVEIEKTVEANPDKAATTARHAHEMLQKLSQQHDSLTHTLKSFSRMTRPGEMEIVRLEDIVNEAVEILRDAAASAQVTVAVLPAPHLYFTRAQVTHLQQVLVNVLQNAIQQLALIQPKRKGRVEIRLANVTNSGDSMLQVVVEDDGPGIHHQLCEQRIFEMDYTTRPEGSGLGLFMSRSLIEAQKGRIYVARSCILWGTTFVIELPYRV